MLAKDGAELIENIDELGAFGVGLASMKERIKVLGGTLRVESGSEGTRLTATLPIRETQDQARLMENSERVV